MQSGVLFIQAARVPFRLVGRPAGVQRCRSQRIGVRRPRANHVQMSGGVAEQIVTSLSSAGIPPLVAVAAVSALPILELRAGIPAGFLLGIQPWISIPVAAFVGNVLPIPVILFVLSSPVLAPVLAPFLKAARNKIPASLVPKDPNDSALPKERVQLKTLLALAFFVGVPLPGTGAWTGAMIAHLLGIPVISATVAVAAGVAMASTIVTAILVAGTKGGLWVGLAAFGLFLAGALLASKSESSQEESADDKHEV